MEYKAVGTELKALAEEGRYSGYFSVFNTVDDGMDIVRPGAFTKTIQERAARIKVFFGHDWSKLVGPAPDKIIEDSKGLYVEGRLTLGSFWGRETWALLKDNAINEGSFGYETISGKVNYLDSGIREIFELKLYEVSFVPLGMNPLTEIEAIKALRTGDPARYALTLEALLAELKAGARHSKADSEAIQRIHDEALSLGAMCVMEEEEMDAPAPDGEGEKTATLRAAQQALALRSRAAAQALSLANRR